MSEAGRFPPSEVKGSGFAKKVVSDLGVKGDDANAAAAIIDRVARITSAQLEALDPVTRGTSIARAARTETRES